MKIGLLYQATLRGRNHMVVELVEARGREADSPNGRAACGLVIDPCTVAAESRGYAGVEYRGQWLTCLRCREMLAKERS
jgi:hypothetical protein